MANRLRKITFELTRACPNQCLHCSTTSSPSVREALPPQMVLDIVEEGARLGLETVILSGGEPLVYPSILGLVDALHARGLRIVIYTSGSFGGMSLEAHADARSFLAACAGKLVQQQLNYVI